MMICQVHNQGRLASKRSRLRAGTETEELKMNGRINKDMISRDAIQGALPQMTERVGRGGYTLLNRIRVAWRLRRLALLTAATVALTSFPALGLARRSAPAPAAGSVAAEIVNRAEQHL